MGRLTRKNAKRTSQLSIMQRCGRVINPNSSKEYLGVKNIYGQEASQFSLLYY